MILSAMHVADEFFYKPQEAKMSARAAALVIGEERIRKCSDTSEFCCLP
jgi:hypothetical protein